MTSKTNKIISAVVIIAVVLAIAVLVYVNLPKQTETPEDNNQDNKIIPPTFALIYNDEQTNFTLALLERLEPYTAKGGYATQSGSIKGVGNYTGVNITTLINTLQPIPYRYSLEVISDDGSYSFNYTTIMGYVNVYDPENGSILIGKRNMTMVLAYQFEGDWFNETNDGKLKIVFLDENGSITESALWRKKVNSIRVITE